MHSKIDKFLWPNKWSLMVAGLWPMNPNIHIALRYFTYFRITFSIIFVTTIVVPQLFEIMDNWGDLTVLTEIGSIVIMLALAVFKECYLVACHVKFEDMYWLLRKLWKLSKNHEESESLENCAIQAMIFTILFYVVGTMTYVMYITAPIYVWKYNQSKANGSDYDRNLLFGKRFWYDTRTTPIFEMTYAYQAVALFSAGNTIVGMDGTMMALILHIVGQFRLISVRFKQIGLGLNADVKPIDVWQNMINCIRHHKLMLRVADEMNSLLGPIIVGQLMLAGLEICLNGYAVMSGDVHGAHLIKYWFLLITVITQLIIWCWPGDLLIQESTGIARMICQDVPWFELPYKQQRDLCLVIVRSQKECQVTALGLQIMSLQKLTEVFNAAASYMALLRSMKEKQVSSS